MFLIAAIIVLAALSVGFAYKRKQKQKVIPASIAAAVTEQPLDMRKESDRTAEAEKWFEQTFGRRPDGVIEINASSPEEAAQKIKELLARHIPSDRAIQEVDQQAEEMDRKATVPGDYTTYH